MLPTNTNNYFMNPFDIYCLSQNPTCGNDKFTYTLYKNIALHFPQGFIISNKRHLYKEENQENTSAHHIISYQFASQCCSPIPSIPILVCSHCASDPIS